MTVRDEFKPVIIKVGGALLDDAEASARIWAAIAAATRPIILVHGGGSATDRLLARLGHTTARHAGLRVTPDDQIDDVTASLAGTVNAHITAHLVRAGARAIGTTIAAAGITTCQQHPDTALARVGIVTNTDSAPLHALLAAGFVPVLSTIGRDANAQPLNVNADDAAAAIARAAHAAQLLLLTDVPGVLDADGNAIPHLDEPTIESLITAGTITGGMIPKVRAALHTATTAACPVSIAPWRDPTALAAELSTNPTPTGPDNTHFGTTITAPAQTKQHAP